MHICPNLHQNPYFHRVFRRALPNFSAWMDAVASFSRIYAIPQHWHHCHLQWRFIYWDKIWRESKYSVVCAYRSLLFLECLLMFSLHELCEMGPWGQIAVVEPSSSAIDRGHVLVIITLNGHDALPTKSMMVYRFLLEWSSDMSMFVITIRSRQLRTHG